jgi:hypothetical protein
LGREGKGVEILGWGKQSLRGEAFSNFSLGVGDGGELGCGKVGDGGYKWDVEIVGEVSGGGGISRGFEEIVHPARVFTGGERSKGEEVAEGGGG